jgi:phage N-6-adenine-methyltransferase
MDKLASQEACQLYIEQEIEIGLEKGKTAYAIGKEIAEWVERLFGAKIKPKTIMERARRQKLSTNVDSDVSARNHWENEEKRDREEGGKFAEGHNLGGRPPKFAAIPDTTIATKWTGDAESYTPKEYIELAREVMGSIDTDPASCDNAQKIVQASVYYTMEDDGLIRDWVGNVFINPPYSYGVVDRFVEKLLDEIEEGNVNQCILLTNNNTDTAWFRDAALRSDLICFTKGRVNFVKADGSKTSPTNGQAFFYFGTNTNKFHKLFSRVGLIMKVV